MEVKASLKHLRIAPRKTRLVAAVVRGLEVNQAIKQLKFLNKKSAQSLLKLLNSAVANATNNFDLDKNNLIIKELKIEDGKTLKRWLPRAHGRATTIRKRMSHVYLTLSEIVDSGRQEAKKQKIEAPIKLNDLAKPVKKDQSGKTGSKAEGKVGSDKGFAQKVFRRKAG